MSARAGSGRARLALAAFLAAGAAFWAACTITTDAPDLWGQDVALTILHTSDIHSRILPYDLQPLRTDQNLGLRADAPPYGGAARLASLIERERGRSQRSILLDSGDCFQGAPIFNANFGEAEFRWLTLMRADAVVVGNHEFDAGVRNFAAQTRAWVRYPLLSANYDWYDYRDPRFTELGQLTHPFTIINAKGLRIAVIGMANISSLNSIGEGGNSLQVNPLEQNETARAWIDFLGESVDLIGVVSHLGLSEDQDLVNGYESVYWKDDIRPYLERERDPWRVVEELGDGKVVVFIPGVRNLDFIAGGHLHVVTAPPQLLTDVDGRKVVLFHSGAFAKYLGRLDLVARMPEEPSKQDALERTRGAEIVAHDYYAFPVDAVWCHDHRTTPELSPDADPEQVAPFIRAARDECAKQEHAKTLELLDPYVVGLARRFDLPRIFAYAPREVLRRNSSTGGDAPLGNMTAESMRVRERVEAEFSVTNTLGIRDSLYRGPVTIESMFNVFPFENTITIMYLSGDEIQELLDFVASRSSGRGCQSQAQVAGLRFTMDCGQVLRNDVLASCERADDCSAKFPEVTVDWQCRESTCWSHAARDITLNGVPISSSTSYKLATNDYIAKGGSGFTVLKRNTTKQDTGISLRDALIEYMRARFCTCEELLAGGDLVARCPQNAIRERGERIIDPLAADFCATAQRFVDYRDEGGDLLAEGAPTVFAGKCNCNDILHDSGDVDADRERRDAVCGYVTGALEQFCEDPLAVPIVIGVEDDRIVRRIQ